MSASTWAPRRARGKLGAGELVSVSAGGNASAPGAFIWRGRRYRVRSIEPLRPPNGAVSGGRRWFGVRTQCGLRALLSQDLGTRRWRMEGVLSDAGN